ncbi:MAG: ATP-binding protein [Anaerolineae bacterium]|nr:ATP-binding protein [Anaerolineae bacterium]MBN8619361.1 ATP-binding protein [Anaerolineae bacterium]
MIFSPDSIRLELPATPKYLNVLTACIGEMLQRVEGLAEPEQTIYNIQLAVHEGCTNIIDHAYNGAPGRMIVELNLEFSPNRLIVNLHDNGQQFDPMRVPEPELGIGQERGYGLFLMRQIMDEVYYEPNDGHNHWRLVKHL